MAQGRRFTLGKFSGRKVAVVGIGKSNQALTRYLAREGAEITCFDRKTAEEMGPVYDELSGLGVRWSLGPDYLSSLPEYKWVFLTPGMKKDQPEIAQARANGAVISSEVGLLMDRCKCPIAAVTGSAGKTTTSALAGMMLREGLPGRPVYVGGNIGSVLIEAVDEIPEDAVVVLELSSFQLELTTKSPHVSLILNIRPNHLDIHNTYEEYVAAKKRIYKFQEADDWCFLNLDDDVTRELASECPGGIGFFTTDVSKTEKPALGAAGQSGAPSSRLPMAWADEHSLYVDAGPLCRSGVPGARSGSGPRKIADRSDLLIPGEHNVSNALAASLLAAAMGAAPEGIGAAITRFKGVEHRIEFVRELRGVRYFNDSIATSPDRTMALLDTIPGPLVLILGGYDKGLPFDELAEKVIDRGCPVITLGKTAPKIENALRAAWEKRGSGDRGSPDIQRAASLEEAVRLASEKSAPGWSVALSPACASYDMFTSFEERGRLFKEAVRRLE